MPDYNFSMRSDIMHALNRHNEIIPKAKSHQFTLLDGTILCLVKSFTDQGQDFYMSNEQLGKLLIVNPCTIQRSVNRLVDTGLLAKGKTYNKKSTCRTLTYQHDAINKLIVQKTQSATLVSCKMQFVVSCKMQLYNNNYIIILTN